MRPPRPGGIPPQFDSSPSPRPFPSNRDSRSLCRWTARFRREQSAGRSTEVPLHRADLSIRWHLLGHLQTNKARKAASAFAMIQGVDSVELLQKLDRAAEESGRTPELLIQVDLAGEATKFGAPPGEVPRLFEAAAACRAARVVGLMTLPPISGHARRRATLVSTVTRSPRRVAGFRRSRADAARAVDGDERGLRGRHSGRRDDGTGRHGDFWEPTCRTMKT